jgi:hypothetical protein
LGILFVAVNKNSNTEARDLQENAERTPLLEPAESIARELSVSTRYVHYLATEGRIPFVRFGRGKKGCVRFNRGAVFAALGIHTEAAATCGAEK